MINAITLKGFTMAITTTSVVPSCRCPFFIGFTANSRHCRSVPALPRSTWSQQRSESCTCKVQYAPHLFHPVLDKRACQGEAARALYFLHGKRQLAFRLFHSVGLVNDDHPTIQLQLAESAHENGSSFKLSIVFLAVSKETMTVISEGCGIGERTKVQETTTEQRPGLGRGFTAPYLEFKETPLRSSVRHINAYGVEFPLPLKSATISCSRTLLTSVFGQTIRAVGQCFGLMFEEDERINLFRRWKSADVPVLRIIAESCREWSRPGAYKGDDLDGLPEPSVRACHAMPYPMSSPSTPPVP